jgi:hypothetical protein
MKLLALIGGGNTKPDRTGLIAAIEARDQALQVVADRRETLARLQSVDDHANQLARAAADATKDATASRQRWVDNGCLSNAREHHEASEAAARAASAAQLAAADAKAARLALPAAQAAVESAIGNLKTCEQRIDEQIGLIQLDQFKATLEDFKRVSAERHTLHIELRAFLEASLSGEASRQVSRVLEECAVKPIADYWSTRQGTHVSSPPDSVLERARQWRDEAKALRGEPNAN